MNNAKTPEDNFGLKFKKRIYDFVVKMIEFIDKLPNDNVSRRLGDQLLRSSTSILGNYAEGRSASSKKDFLNFLTIALKSANESKIWIELLKDSKRCTGEDISELMAELVEISNVLARSVLTLKGKN